MTGTTSVVTIRPLRWWDIPAVAAIELDLFPEDSPWTEAMFWSELAQGHQYRSCWDGAELVGYAGLALQPDEACVQTIAVVRSHQGRGLGRRLLLGLLETAGERPISLEVRTDNATAIALYESVGFRTAGVRRRYYQPSGANAYTMWRPVEPS